MRIVNFLKFIYYAILCLYNINEIEVELVFHNIKKKLVLKKSSSNKIINKAFFRFPRDCLIYSIRGEDLILYIKLKHKNPVTNIFCLESHNSINKVVTGFIIVYLLGSILDF